MCLEVEEISDKDHWTTVLTFGRNEEIHQNPEDAEVRRRAEQLFVQRREWWLPAAGKVEGREHPDVVVYRIQIDRLPGRRATRERDSRRRSIGGKISHSRGRSRASAEA